MIIKRLVLKTQRQIVPFQISGNQQALLMPVGDIHWGAPHFPTAHFQGHLQWGMDRGAMFLGMGDYLDFTSLSQRNIIKATRDSTMSKLDEAVMYEADLFLKATSFTKGRWIGMIAGNHSWTFQDGTSVEQYLCKGLGCDYLGDMALLRLSPKKTMKAHPEADIMLVAHHGVGGGMTIGGQLNRPEQLLKWIECDIVLMGHTHAKLAAPIDKICVTPDGVVSHRTVVIARTGAFLQAYYGQEPLDNDIPANKSAGSYVEKRVMMPAAMGGLCFSFGYEQIRGSVYYRPVIHFSI